MKPDDSSSEGSSSSDEDLDFLFLVCIHISLEICFYFTLFIVVKPESNPTGKTVPATNSRPAAMFVFKSFVRSLLF